MKDEATAAFKQLQETLAQLSQTTQGLSAAHVTATEAVHAHASAAHEAADEMREASYVTRLLAESHSMLAEKLREGAMVLGKFGAVLGEMGVGGLIAAGSIGLLAERSLDAVKVFANFEAQGVRLNATLRALGEGGKISLEELDETAQKVGRSTLFSPAEMLSGGVEISKVAGVTGEQIKSLLPQLADLAAYMGTNVPVAAEMLTRVLQDPVQGMMYLQRITRDVTQAEREHVQQLMMAGDIEGARQVILDKLSEKTNGFASALREGLAGAFRDATNELGIFLEEGTKGLGRQISDALHLESAFRAVADSIREVNEAAERQAARAKEAQTPMGAAEALMEQSDALRSGETTAGRSAFNTPLLAYALPGLYNQAQTARWNEMSAAADKKQAEAEDLLAVAALGRGGDASSAASAPSSYLTKQLIDTSLKDTESLDSYNKKLAEYKAMLEGAQKALQAAEANQSEFGDKIPVLQERIDLLTNALAGLHTQLEALNRSWEIKIDTAGLSKFNQEVYKLAAQRYAAEHPGIKADDVTFGQVRGTSDWQAAADQQKAQALATLSATTDTDNTLAPYYAAVRAAGNNAAAREKASQRLKAAQFTVQNFGDLNSPLAQAAFNQQMQNEAATSTADPNKGNRQSPVQQFQQRTAAAQYQAGLYQDVSAGVMPLGQVKVMVEAYSDAIKEAQQHTMSFQEAMAQLTPIIQKRIEAENQQLILQTQISTSMQTTVTAAKGRSAFEGLQAQFIMEGQQKGIAPGSAQMDAYRSAQTAATQSKTFDKWADQTNTMRDQVEQMQLQQRMAFAATAEYEKQLSDLKLIQEARAQGIPLESTQLQEMLKENDALSEMKQKTEDIANGALAKWVKSNTADWNDWQSVAVGALSDTENAVGSLITRTSTLHGAMTTLLRDFSKLFEQEGMKVLNTALFGGGGGSPGLAGGGGSPGATGGGVASGLFGSLSNGIMGKLGGGIWNWMTGAGGAGAVGASGLGGVASFAADSNAFANGGIMTQYGSLPLKRYAGGGVAASPQVALFGEGAHNEAYVPLPDGRSIPVSMRGGGGGASLTNHFNVTVQAPPGGMGGANPNQFGDGIAMAMRNMVVQVMHDQMRTGGALNPVMGSP